MHNVYFIYKGSGQVLKRVNSKQQGEFLAPVINLPEGSFFGELCALIGTVSYFTFAAAPPMKKTANQPSNALT